MDDATDGPAPPAPISESAAEGEPTNGLAPTAGAALAFVAVALGLVGQQLLTGPKRGWAGAAAYAFAIAAFFWLSDLRSGGDDMALWERVLGRQPQQAQPMQAQPMQQAQPMPQAMPRAASVRRNPS
jgi:hypothetical protein